MPSDSAKNVRGNSDSFTNFMRRLMQVPHSEIKAKLEAEKKTKRTRTKAASRVPAAPTKPS